MSAQWNHPITRVECPWGCGAALDRFTDDIGIRRYLEIENLPINADLLDPGIRRRVWEYRGKGVGWARKDILKRNWRPLRIEHICEKTPKVRKNNNNV